MSGRGELIYTLEFHVLLKIRSPDDSVRGRNIPPLPDFRVRNVDDLNRVSLDYRKKAGILSTFLLRSPVGGMNPEDGFSRKISIRGCGPLFSRRIDQRTKVVKNIRNLTRSQLVRPTRHILNTIRDQMKKIGIGFSLQKSGPGKIRNGRVQVPPTPVDSAAIHSMADGTIQPINLFPGIQTPGSDTMRQCGKG